MTPQYQNFSFSPRKTSENFKPSPQKNHMIDLYKRGNHENLDSFLRYTFQNQTKIQNVESEPLTAATSFSMKKSTILPTDQSDDFEEMPNFI